MSESAIALQNVRKEFGDFTALSDVSFDIADNEFFTLLGPSGCGKTTLLRLIAGFEDTTAGTIHLYGEEIENLPPNKRPVNTVFQNYALFPHMTVAQNIAFALQMLGWSQAETDARGHFSISFDPETFNDWGLDKRPDVYFKVLSADGKPIAETSHNIIKDARPGIDPIVIHVPTS